MSKKPTVLFTLAMLAFGGYVGFVTNYTNTATAHEYVIPKFTDVPRAKDFNIDINLNNNAIKLNGQSNPEQNINVEIKKKDSIIYLTSIVEKEVPKYIKVRELPSVKENKTTCTDILQRLKQKTIREDKSESQLEQPMRLQSYNGVYLEISKSKDQKVNGQIAFLKLRQYRILVGIEYSYNYRLLLKV